MSHKYLHSALYFV